MTQLTTKLPKAPVKGRIRPALAAAIRLIVESGHTQAYAAKAVGMNPVSLSLALRKPHVRALRIAVKHAWLESQTDKAWVTVADLASNAASEDVRLKAAKTILEAAGELSPSGANDTGPRSLVQIMINHPLKAGEGASNTPGVIEIVRTPGRQGDPYQVIAAG